MAVPEPTEVVVPVVVVVPLLFERPERVKGPEPLNVTEDEFADGTPLLPDEYC